jgi:outer membrane receptor protein involved in Fe transport
MTNKVGLQLRYDRISPLALVDTMARETVNTVRQDEVKEGSAGIYAENSVQWTRWLRSVLGLRFDRYTFNVGSDNPANSGKVAAHITSPKLALILGPWAKTEFFVNYGEGFHSNDARGTTTRVSPSTGITVDPVTPLVKSRGGELGARTEIIPGLQSSLALWRLKLGSELIFTGDAGDTVASRASRRSGVEWTNYWRLQPWLLLDFNLAASKARLSEEDPAGNYIPGSIDKVASLGLTVTDWQGWFGALQWRYFGPRPLIEDNSQRSAATSLAYLRIGRQIDKSARLSLEIYNLFDRKVSDIDYYYASRLRGEPPGGVNDIHFHPVEPRTLRATLQLSF